MGPRSVGSAKCQQNFNNCIAIAVRMLQLLAVLSWPLKSDCSFAAACILIPIPPPIVRAFYRANLNGRYVFDYCKEAAIMATTRKKRFGLLAASLAVAAGTGYGGYTQRHLILGDAEAEVAAADADAAVEGEAAAPQPITVSAEGDQFTSPSRFSNPLREERVVRGNDGGSERPAGGSSFQPPPNRFGGSAVAQVEVTDDTAGSTAQLTPAPTFSDDASAPGGFDNTSPANEAPPEASGNRFTPPENTLAPAPVAETDGPPASRFSGSVYGDGSAPVSPPPGPAPAQPFGPESLPAQPLTPPSSFGTSPDPIAPPQELPASNRFADEGTTPPLGSNAVGTGAIGAGFQNDPVTGTQIEGAGRPGDKTLEGAQTPAIVIEKFAPPEVQIGKPAKFDIKVKNVGQATAENVVVTDQVPQGTRLIDSSPQAAAGNGDNVIWQLGTLRANEEKTVSMQLMPVGEGEIGSVATVTFSAQASARTKATRPQLLVETTGPRQVLIGQPVKLTIRLSNPGTGAATRVVLEEDVPEGLSHPGGQALEFEAGTLKPGETRELELTLSATGAGVVQNVIRARADANLSVESRVAIEVIAPDLAIAVDGPSKRYLERQATHELIISNPGTAPAKNVEMVAHLPKGLKYVSANNQGQYDATSHAVFWSLEQLSPRDKGTVALTTVPMEAGQQKIRVESKADMNLATAQEHVVEVEGLAALFFEVADAADPIEVGGETIYEVRVINQGTKTSTNVRLAAAMPPSLKPLEAGGATSGVISDQQVVFEPLPRLAPKADALYRIRVQGLAKGNAQVRVLLSSDEIPGGVTKEESTRVYADE